jgi:hypothetical protein
VGYRPCDELIPRRWSSTDCVQDYETEKISKGPTDGCRSIHNNFELTRCSRPPVAESWRLHFKADEVFLKRISMAICPELIMAAVAKVSSKFLIFSVLGCHLEDILTALDAENCFRNS